MGRTVAPGEPVWLEDDTMLAVEWQRLQDETCPGCGHLLSESMDEATEYDVQSLTCFACQAKDQTERALAAKENADLSGRKLIATKAGRREPLMS
ncbi:hypothetical protein AB0K09_00440 [Streptomyces sp. NPDC049577]|uniref:hypothetical protein n=1 Tax=Streptomyces sp. NPDC049577 TaxID=3155153 RepID=UPI0034359DC2